MSDQKMIGKYFTLHEALYLPKWNREASRALDGLNDAHFKELGLTFQRLDALREHFNKPIIVHCAIRPEAYNKEVGGAPKSAHMYGMAVDFHIKDVDCDVARQEILDKDLLRQLKMRMEDSPGSDWIHIDTRPVFGKYKFFKP